MAGTAPASLVMYDTALRACLAAWRALVAIHLGTFERSPKMWTGLVCTQRNAAVPVATVTTVAAHDICSPKCELLLVLTTGQPNDHNCQGQENNMQLGLQHPAITTTITTHYSCHKISSIRQSSGMTGSSTPVHWAPFENKLSFLPAQLLASSVVKPTVGENCTCSRS